jgi:hypothetical protein
MANRYYVQFNAGLGELAVGALHRDLPAARVVFQDDSAAIIESAAEPSQVAALPYLTGSLLFLAGARRGPLAAVVPSLASQLDRAGAAGRTPRRRPFRVVTSVDGALVALPPRARARLESAVAARTGGWVQARGSGEEYWVVGRRAPQQGALGPELADLLVRASGPRPHDVFLDPFGGRGSIIWARLRYPARRVIYSDTGYHELRRQFRPELARARSAEFLSEDARALPSVADAAMDVIVTDPPWGEFRGPGAGQLADFPEFAAGLAATVRRVLRRPAGRFVILISRRQEENLRQALADAGLVPAAAHRILVSGHPATVLAGRTGHN